MHIGLRVSIATLTVLATTISVAAFQTDEQQKLINSYEATTTKPHIALPQWPYPAEVPIGSVLTHAHDDGQPRHLPGSTKAYTITQADGNVALDWFPEMHPKAPTAVTDGKKDVFFSCGSCHLITGVGRPDVQSLNGMPVAYMQQQLEDMRNDLRHSSVVFGDVVHMNHVAKSVPEADAKDALEYFHSIGPVKWIRVVETETVPKIVPAGRELAIPDPSGTKEPLGNRILELPENYERTLLRDPTSGFVAYVPPDSLAKGEVLVKTGAGGRTIACTACHGPDLRGMIDTIPPLAGHSPTAIGRQLYDFKMGTRHGKNSAMMAPVVEKLTDEDIVDITAYLASLPQ